MSDISGMEVFSILFFFFIISLVPISSFKLLSQQQFMNGLSWSRTKKSFTQFSYVLLIS